LFLINTFMPKYIKAKEFQNLPKRFIAVKQDDGRSRLQDLEGAPDRLMTNKEVVAQSQAIGAQNQAAIQAGRAFQDRMRRENLARGEKEYGPGFASKVKAQANKITSDVQAQQAAKRASPEYKAAIQAQAERNVDARLNPQNVAVSQKVGFDVAGSQQRTSAVLAQSERAERMADESRRKAAKVGLFRESVDYYKDRLNENIMRALGRWVGPKLGAARRGVSAVANIPGVKPVARTALLAGGVAAGAYAYNKYLSPSKAQIDPRNAAGIDPKTGKRKSMGSSSTRIVYKPERNTQATDAYREMLNAPGGYAGAMRKQRADTILAKWEKETPLQQIPSRESELEKIKANTSKMEAELRRKDIETNGPMPVNPQGDNEPGWEIRRAERIRQSPEYKAIKFQRQAQRETEENKKKGPKANQPIDLN
jgi:hypothetical protein